MKTILILTDNEVLLERFIEQYNREKTIDHKIDSRYSDVNKNMKLKYGDDSWLKPLNVKKDTDILIKKYDIIFSLHSKQIFPGELVKNVKCINIHPGYNPNNKIGRAHV